MLALTAAQQIQQRSGAIIGTIIGILIGVIIAMVILVIVFIIARRYICQTYGSWLRLIGLGRFCQDIPQRCTTSADCSAGEFCDAKDCVCRSRCTNNSQCGEGYICDTQTSQCRLPSICSKERNPCPVDSPYCTPDGLCTECRTGADCKDPTKPFCTGFKCTGPIACTPSTERSQCGNFKCINGQCAFKCSDDTQCNTPLYRCINGECRRTLLQCDATHPCPPESGMVCRNGVCQPLFAADVVASPESVDCRANCCESKSQLLLQSAPGVVLGSNNRIMTGRTRDENRVQRILLTNASPFGFAVTYVLSRYSNNQWADQILTTPPLPARKSATDNLPVYPIGALYQRYRTRIDKLTFRYLAVAEQTEFPSICIRESRTHCCIGHGQFDGSGDLGFFYPSDSDLERFVDATGTLSVEVIALGQCFSNSDCQLKDPSLCCVANICQRSPTGTCSNTTTIPDVAIQSAISNMDTIGDTGIIPSIINVAAMRQPATIGRTCIPWSWLTRVTVTNNTPYNVWVFMGSGTRGALDDWNPNCTNCWCKDYYSVWLNKGQTGQFVIPPDCQNSQTFSNITVYRQLDRAGNLLVELPVYVHKTDGTASVYIDPNSSSSWHCLVCNVLTCNWFRPGPNEESWVITTGCDLNIPRRPNQDIDPTKPITYMDRVTTLTNANDNEGQIPILATIRCDQRGQQAVLYNTNLGACRIEELPACS